MLQRDALPGIVSTWPRSTPGHHLHFIVPSLSSSPAWSVHPGFPRHPPARPRRRLHPLPREQPMKVSILALSAMFGALGSARAQTPPLPPWGLGMEDVTAIMVPPAIRSQLGDLEYEDADSIEGVSVDLDGDARPPDHRDLQPLECRVRHDDYLQVRWQGICRVIEAHSAGNVAGQSDGGAAPHSVVAASWPVSPRWPVALRAAARMEHTPPRHGGSEGNRPSP
jgi:hypothetical protein